VSATHDGTRPTFTEDEDARRRDATRRCPTRRADAATGADQADAWPHRFGGAGCQASAARVESIDNPAFTAEGTS
jgi:hypothetical protein